MDDNPDNNGNNIPKPATTAHGSHPEPHRQTSLQRGGASTNLGLSFSQPDRAVPHYNNAVLQAEGNQEHHLIAYRENYGRGFNDRNGSAASQLDLSMDIDGSGEGPVFSKPRAPYSAKTPAQPRRSSTGPVREPRTQHRSSGGFYLPPAFRTGRQVAPRPLSVSEDSGIMSGCDTSDLDREPESTPASPWSPPLTRDYQTPEAPTQQPTWSQYNVLSTPSSFPRRKSTDPDPFSRLGGKRSGSYCQSPSPDDSQVQKGRNALPSHVRQGPDMFINKESSASDSGGEGMVYALRYQQVERERSELIKENCDLRARMEGMADRFDALMGKVEDLIETKSKSNGALANALGDMSNMVASQLLKRADGQAANVNEAKETVATFVVALATLSGPKVEAVSKEDIPAVKYYTETEWKYRKKIVLDPNMSKSEKKKYIAPRFYFLENANGSQITPEDWSDISYSCRRFCNSLKGIPGALEPKWGGTKHVWLGALENYLVPKYPILSYGQNLWKICHFMTLWYPDYAKRLAKEGYFPESVLQAALSPPHSRSNSVSDMSDLDFDDLERFSSRSPSPVPPPPSNSLSVPQLNAKRSASVPPGTANIATHSSKKKKSSIQLPAGVPASTLASDTSGTMDIDIDGQEEVNVSSVQLKLTPASSPPANHEDDSMMNSVGVDGDDKVETDPQCNQSSGLPLANLEAHHPPKSAKSPNPLAGVMMEDPSELVAAYDTMGVQSSKQPTTGSVSNANLDTGDLVMSSQKLDDQTGPISPITDKAGDNEALASSSGDLDLLTGDAVADLSGGGDDGTSTHITMLPSTQAIEPVQSTSTSVGPNDPFVQRRVANMKALAVPEVKRSGQNLCHRMFVDYANFLITGCERSQSLASQTPALLEIRIDELFSKDTVVSKLSSKQKVYEENGVIYKKLPEETRKQLERESKLQKKIARQNLA